MSVFGKYADFYDFLYRDKDYKNECAAFEEIFSKYSKQKVHSILDLGCGTGNHAIILHKRGYKIVGVDRSEIMLNRAKKKIITLPNKRNITFAKGDIRTWRSDQKFDAAVMMFAVLGYQLENKDVLQALATVRRHLKNGGLFIFDIWYGPAVSVQKPSDRIKIVATPTGRIIRIASSETDITRQICTVHYTTLNIDSKHLINEIKGNHQMRYFFSKELALLLEVSQLKIIRLGAFPNWKEEISENTWNIFGIAKAI